MVEWLLIAERLIINTYFDKEVIFTHRKDIMLRYLLVSLETKYKTPDTQQYKGS